MRKLQADQPDDETPPGVCRASSTGGRVFGCQGLFRREMARRLKRAKTDSKQSWPVDVPPDLNRYETTSVSTRRTPGTAGLLLPLVFAKAGTAGDKSRLPCSSSGQKRRAVVEVSQPADSLFGRYGFDGCDLLTRLFCFGGWRVFPPGPFPRRGGAFDLLFPPPDGGFGSWPSLLSQSTTLSRHGQGTPQRAFTETSRAGGRWQRFLVREGRNLPFFRWERGAAPAYHGGCRERELPAWPNRGRDAAGGGGCNEAQRNGETMDGLIPR